MLRRRLSARDREALYQSECERAREAGKGEHAICNICTFPILPGREWDASHDPTKPRWLGGEITGIAHKKCNRLHNNKIDTPLFAKNERIRKRHLDLTRSANPLPGGRDDRLKKCLNGRVVERR